LSLTLRKMTSSINPGQHGFRAGRSCLSQLITHFDNILKILEENDNVDIIYVDFAKAFDKVDFQVTLRKLKKLGISGKLWTWIHEFLTGRCQAVLVNGSKSKPSNVKSGVPQGSVLGPLLFLILIGDIDCKVVTSFVSSFADDTRIGRRIKTESDVTDLQADLNSIYEWAVDNNMMFNNEKFECLRYGRNKDILAHTGYTSSSGCDITVQDSVRDLGVTMSSDGTFKKHIVNVIETANNMCGWILRTFRTRAAHPMLTLWKSMVLSKLDYCKQGIFRPWSVHIDHL
jgi:ribonuclease P/MRP protein subunit RPP40